MAWLIALPIKKKVKGQKKSLVKNLEPLCFSKSMLWTCHTLSCCQRCCFLLQPMFHRQIGSALKMKSFFNQDLSPSWFIRSRSSRDNKKQKYMLHRNPTIYVKKWKPGNGEMSLSFLETSLCSGHCSANDGQTVYNNGIIHEAGYDHDLVVKQPRGRLGIAHLVGLPTPQLAEHPPRKTALSPKQDIMASGINQLLSWAKGHAEKKLPEDSGDSAVQNLAGIAMYITYSYNIPSSKFPWPC